VGLLDLSSVFADKDIPEKYKGIITRYKKRINELEDTLQKTTREKEKSHKLSVEQKKINSDLMKKLTIDYKTGLPNRLKLSEFLPAWLDISTYQENEKLLGVLIIQLDKSYSVLTKTLKSNLVEWVLYKIGVKLQKIAGRNSLFHTRENEFIIILKKNDSIDTIIKYSQEITKAIKKTENISGYHISIGSNTGIAIFPEHGITKEQLLTAADIALDNAKERKLEQLVFKNEYKQIAMEKLELQNFMIKALEMNTMNGMDEQFVMHFQPVIKVDEGADGKLRIEAISAEALIRWNHPEKGMISPNKFIPLSEETGIIVLLGNWIMYKVADMILSWKEKYNIEIPVSINVSSLQFHEGNLVDFISRIIKTRKIDPGLIRIEITETSLMEDPSEALCKMMQLKDIGIKLCIDDFGTGYSSFNYLRQFTIDILKIDKSFIDNVSHSSCDQAIVRAIAAMSGELEFDVIVEGVEDLNQFNFLYKEGCRNFQGFLFSKPLPPERFIDFYENNINKKIFS
jgi:diguanylate cyclase (GGDEF)-like protein